MLKYTGGCERIAAHERLVPYPYPQPYAKSNTKLDHPRYLFKNMILYTIVLALDYNIIRAMAAKRFENVRARAVTRGGSPS